MIEDQTKTTQKIKKNKKLTKIQDLKTNLKQKNLIDPHTHAHTVRLM